MLFPDDDEIPEREILNLMETATVVRVALAYLNRSADRASTALLDLSEAAKRLDLEKP